MPAWCVAKGISWALVLHAFPAYPAMHTEVVAAPSCYAEAWLCETAKNAAVAAFAAVGHQESRAECVEQHP